MFHDMYILGQSIFITIEHSKNDQARKGAKIILGPCSDRELCLVEVLGLYMTM